MYSGDEKLILKMRTLGKMRAEGKKRHFFPPLPITAALSQNHSTTSDSFLLLPGQYTSFFCLSFFSLPPPSFTCKKN